MNLSSDFSLPEGADEKRLSGFRASPRRFAMYRFSTPLRRIGAHRLRCWRSALGRQSTCQPRERDLFSFTSAADLFRSIEVPPINGLTAPFSETSADA